MFLPTFFPAVHLNSLVGWSKQGK